MTTSSVRSDGLSGARALAEGCDRALTAVHGLPADFAATVQFDNPANASHFPSSRR